MKNGLLISTDPPFLSSRVKWLGDQGALVPVQENEAFLDEMFRSTARSCFALKIHAIRFARLTRSIAPPSCLIASTTLVQGPDHFGHL